MFGACLVNSIANANASGGCSRENEEIRRKILVPDRIHQTAVAHLLYAAIGLRNISLFHMDAFRPGDPAICGESKDAGKEAVIRIKVPVPRKEG